MDTARYTQGCNLQLQVVNMQHGYKCRLFMNACPRLTGSKYRHRRRTKILEVLSHNPRGLLQQLVLLLHRDSKPRLPLGAD